MKNSKINLLVDAHVFDDHFQGSRTYISGLYRSLIRQAPWIHFFFAASDTETLHREFGSHDHVSFVKLRLKNSLFRLSVDLPRIIIQNKISIAHFQYAVPLIKRCKEIVTIHDVLFMDYPEYFPFFYRLIRKPIFKYAAQRADNLLTVSDYAKHSISKNLRIAENKITVLPNGIDKSFLQSKASSCQVSFPYILYVSRWEPRKNHVLLMKAFRELRLHTHGLKLVFIGKKDIQSNDFDLYWKTMSNEEQSSVLFLDSVSQEELKSYYENCSLFVYPSLAEGFGIPPLEAAALGIPVLCSNTTGMSDFTFFENGLFDPFDKEELKKKISVNLSHKNKTEIERIQSHVIRIYDWDLIAAKFLQVINAQSNATYS